MHYYNHRDVSFCLLMHDLIENPRGYIVNDKVECIVDVKEDWKIEKCGEYNLQSIEKYYDFFFCKRAER